MTGSTRTDRDLIAAIRAGDRTAADEFAHRHLDWAVEYAQRRGAGDHAEDIVHEIFGDLIARPTVQLKLPSAGPYLKTCIVRRIAHLRGDQNRADRTPGVQVDPGTSPSSLAARLQIVEAVQFHLQELRTAKRELVLLRYRDDLEPTEIAERTGQPAGTVRKDLSRIRRWLAKKFFDQSAALQGPNPSRGM